MSTNSQRNNSCWLVIEFLLATVWCFLSFRMCESPTLSLRPALPLHPSLRVGARAWSSTCTPGFQGGGAGTALHRTLMGLPKIFWLVLPLGIYLVRNSRTVWWNCKNTPGLPWTCVWAIFNPNLVISRSTSRHGWFFQSTGRHAVSEHVHQAGSPVCSAGVLTAKGNRDAFPAGEDRR